eukprot:TRINITY_DN16891_c0_g1_i2.p1 TRINITY_DN16891_c0_g1~~TRINITY_DN16891_c0_g1_i2.p1  ORF type:complete len:443 (+),score=114.49 TRINITY_DN16891_c0_g1_i2:49-1329(+)
MVCDHLKPKRYISCEEVFGTNKLPAEPTKPDLHALHIGFGEERPLDTDVFHALLNWGKAALDSEPNVLDISGRVCVVGPLRGQLYDLMHVLTVLCAPKGQSPPAVPTAFEATPEMPFRNQYTQRISLDPDLKLVFLGDMIDGGHQSSQVLLLLLALKLTYPDRVFLLRGRRESKTEWSPRAHSVLLQDELARRYENLPGADPEELYTQCSRVFRSLPIAAVVNEEYFCVSGGIGPGSLSDDPTSLVRQEDTMKQSTLCDLVWSDPMDDEDEDLQSNALFLHNYEKGIGYNYSFNAVMNFITEKKYRCIVRSVSFPDSRDVAPQVTRQSHNSSGRPWHYQYSYYDPGYRLYRRNPLTNFPTVIGLFSAPRFLNENENRGAVMFIEGDKMNLRQFTAACRPFALPKMKNALEWSIPSVCSQAASVAEV